VQNKSKRSLYGILCLIIFSCYLSGSEVFVLSFDDLGNIETHLLTETASPQLTKQIPAKDSQQTPHNHIILSHLYSLEHSEIEISLTHPIAAIFIQPQLLSIQFSENLPNAHFLLSHQEFPQQILSKLSHTIILV
jgi:hypothetical protein